MIARASTVAHAVQEVRPSKTLGRSRGGPPDVADISG
jgi:hypothetical protein